MDAFFASVEELDDPTLRGKPVIVGGAPEERGVVSAANYVARRFGVHSAMSSAMARRLCPHGVFLKPRGRRYVEISRQIVAIFEHYTPLVETLSLDEAFLDVTGSRRLFGTPVEIGREIKRRIREEIGLTASVGIAPNMFLAKLASDLEKPDGFVVIEEREVQTRLDPLAVGKLWGVGPVTQAALEKLGIRTVRELLAADQALLARRLGEDSARALRALAQGIDHRRVEPDSERKSISEETTFARDVADEGRLCATLDALADEVARRLRRHGLRARTIQLKARYPDFTTVTRALTLPAPTASTIQIRQTARELLAGRLGRAGRPLRLVGVGVTNLVADEEGQLELFRDREERDERVDRLLDRLQDKYGPGAIGHGREPVEE